jgi:hypothetical protein
MITMVEHMSPFTYMYLRSKEIWHSYCDRRVEAAWNRAKQRKERERQNSMVKDKIDNIQSYVYNTLNSNTSVFGNNLSNIYSPSVHTLSLGTGPMTLNQGAISMSSESTSLNFTVHTASGGKIVEYRTSSGQSKLYIIPEGADLGQEIGKIITLEILRA